MWAFARPLTQPRRVQQVLRTSFGGGGGHSFLSALARRFCSENSNLIGAKLPVGMPPLTVLPPAVSHD